MVFVIYTTNLFFLDACFIIVAVPS